MDAEAAEMLWDGTGRADGVYQEFNIGKRNARNRDSRRAVRANATVGDKRRTWAGQRQDERSEGKRRKQRRGSGSGRRRKERRAKAGGTEGEDEQCDGEEGWEYESGASQASVEGGSQDGNDTAHAVAELEEQVAELVQQVEDARGKIEQLERKLEEGWRNAKRMFEVREVVDWADGIWEEQEYEGRARVREQWAGWERELGARRLRGDKDGRYYIPGEERVLWRHAVDICKGLVAAAEEARGQVADWDLLKQHKVECVAEVDSLQERLEELRTHWEENEAKLLKAVKEDLKVQYEWLEEKQQHGRQACEEGSRRRKEEEAVIKQAKKELRGQHAMSKAGDGGRTKGGVELGKQPRLGIREQGVLDRVAATDEGMRRKLVSEDMIVYNYRGGDKLQVVADRHSSSDCERREVFQLLSECRGLVVQDGQVVSRPVQRFHRLSEMRGMAAEVIAAVVTEKLDGQMMCGLVVGDGVELWSRGGWTEEAKTATRVAQEQEGMLELVSAVWEQGGSPTFEFIGKQSMVKVRYGETALVLVAVRDRETGNWWDYGSLELLCERYGVQLVSRCKQLEGKTLREVWWEVMKCKGQEGVVVWLCDGQVCKVKTDWWLDRESKKCRRWGSLRDGQGREGIARREKKERYMERRQQRVVLRGWGGKDSPALALQIFLEAYKVEALYKRKDGKQGTVVLGFRSEEAAKAVRGRHVVGGKVVWAEQAHSVRCRSDQYRWVRTWWRQAWGQGEGGCEEESECEGEKQCEGESECEKEKQCEGEPESECVGESECEGVGEEEWGAEEWDDMYMHEKEDWEAEQGYEEASDGHQSASPTSSAPRSGGKGIGEVK